MKHVKRILALCLCAVLACGFFVPSFAAARGDADGDGKLTAEDARRILRATVGLDPLTEQISLYCDLDSDGKITSADARLALRYSVGLLIEETTKEAYIQKLSNTVSYDEVMENFQIFTQEVGSRWYTYSGLTTGKNRVENILVYNGFSASDIVEDAFTCNGETVYNVYTEIPTAKQNPDIILFLAHYDSYYNGSGAVDNASGLSTVLEIARILKKQDIDFGVEIRFLFTACEELGYYGAYRYVNYFSSGSLDRHVAVFNVDMSAHFETSKNQYLCVSTDSAYGSYAYANTPSLAVDEAKSILGSCGEYAYRSPVAAGLHDLIPFNEVGLPTITLSWREINYDNSHGSQDGLAAPAEIHTYYDTYDNTDLDSLYRTTRLAVGAAAALVYDYVK